MVEKGAIDIVYRHPLFFCLAACMGLVVNVLGVTIIKLSSATTFKVIYCSAHDIINVLCMLSFWPHAWAWWSTCWG